MDRKLSALSPILALVFAIVSYSAGADQAQDQVTQQATQTLEVMIKKDVYPLEREMVGFHWETQNNGWEPSSLADIQRHLLNWSSHFFDTSTAMANVGLGVYLATDPLSTRNYGGINDEAELYVVTIKHGTKMLNATRRLTDAEVQAANKIFGDLGCRFDAVQADKVHTVTDVLTNTFVNFSSAISACKPVVQQVMKDLGVEAILYTYSGSYLPQCRQNSYAVNIISPNAIKAEDMAFYDGKFSLEGKSMAGMVRRSWEEAARYDIDALSSLDDNRSLLPSTLQSVPEISDADYESWKSSLYGCGAYWTGETKKSNLDLVSDMIRKQYTDDELHDLEIQLAKGYRARSRYMLYSSLHQLMELSYKATGWAPDMSKYAQWQQAAAKLASGVDSTNGLIEVEQLLEEPTTIPPNQITQDYLNKIGNTYFKMSEGLNPAVIFVAFRKAGLGPRLARLFGNLLITAEGGSPYLGELPADLSTPIASTIAANKAQIKSILRECIKTYADPSVSTDQINGGPCGSN